MVGAGEARREDREHTDLDRGGLGSWALSKQGLWWGSLSAPCVEASPVS